MLLTKSYSFSNMVVSSLAAENGEVNGRVDEGKPTSVLGLRYENYCLYYTDIEIIYIYIM